MLYVGKHTAQYQGFTELVLKVLNELLIHAE